MELPGADSSPGQQSKKTKFKNSEFWIFSLVSNLSQYSLHFPLLRALKNYFCMLKDFLNFVLRTLKNYFLHVKISLNFVFLKIISYELNNDFSYTQLSFVFLLWKVFHFDHDTDAFLSFSSSERFLYLSRVFFSHFFFFFFRRVLVPFMCFFPQLFFVFFIFLDHLYKYR